MRIHSVASEPTSGGGGLGFKEAKSPCRITCGYRGEVG